MLYAGAIEGEDAYIRPNQITRMSDMQAAIEDDNARHEWIMASLRPQREIIPGRWYADTTREPIRDETLRDALKPLGAVIERAGLSPTSSSPRWALAKDFAALFTAPDQLFPEQLDAWRTAHLSLPARARLALIQSQATSDLHDSILVTFPSGETRRLSPGPSGMIAKAVVEEFAINFLPRQQNLWVT
ncbi:MAG: hypothetical protein ACT443_05870 [Gemmatimonadota bacterium]